MELSSFIIQEEESVFDAASAIDANGHQIVFVCNGQKLMASFTDGDLRRYILRAGELSKPVRHAANYSPAKFSVHEEDAARLLLKKNAYMRGIPIIDSAGELVSIVFSDSTSVYKKMQINVPVVIMGGGKGTRLAPFTNILPKPLIPLGDMTITEHIMEQFLNAGCNDFIMIVNYKKGLIKAYFNETMSKGTLHFVEEEEFLGTGGGLKLLEGVINDSFIMTNCDILVKADYEDIVRHHRESGALVTMVCALKKVSVPYGTIEMDEDGKPTRLIEKPEYPILVNTGLYVIEPEFLSMIPAGVFIHITDLIQRLICEGKPVRVYPISEVGWMDMGQLDELAKMSRRFTEVDSDKKKLYDIVYNKRC